MRKPWFHMPPLPNTPEAIQKRFRVEFMRQSAHFSVASVRPRSSVREADLSLFVLVLPRHSLSCSVQTPDIPEILRD